MVTNPPPSANLVPVRKASSTVTLLPDSQHEEKVHVSLRQCRKIQRGPQPQYPRSLRNYGLHAWLHLFHSTVLGISPLHHGSACNLNFGVAETVLVAGRLYPTQFICICLGHHENKSNSSKGLPVRIAPTVSNQTDAQAEIPSPAAPPWHPEGLRGTHLSPLPKHREGSIPDTLSLGWRQRKCTKIIQEQELKPANTTKTSCQGGLCFHPGQHVPVPKPPAHVVPKVIPKYSNLCLLGQHLMLSTQWWLCPSQLPISSLAAATPTAISAEVPTSSSAQCTPRGHLHPHLTPGNSTRRAQ